MTEKLGEKLKFILRRGLSWQKTVNVWVLKTEVKNVKIHWMTGRSMQR